MSKNNLKDMMADRSPLTAKRQGVQPADFYGTGADSQTAGHPDITPTEQPAVQTAKPPRIKATFHLNPDDIMAIDRMQTAEFARTGKKPERSQLVSAAIQQLASQLADRTGEHPDS